MFVRLSDTTIFYIAFILWGWSLHGRRENHIGLLKSEGWSRRIEEQAIASFWNAEDDNSACWRTSLGQQWCRNSISDLFPSIVRLRDKYLADSSDKIQVKGDVLPCWRWMSIHEGVRVWANATLLRKWWNCLKNKCFVYNHQVILPLANQSSTQCLQTAFLSSSIRTQDTIGTFLKTNQVILSTYPSLMSNQGSSILNPSFYKYHLERSKSCKRQWSN